MCCYVCSGKDDASKKTTEAINNPEVSAKLQGGGYVAIRIESDSTAHQQFAQICILSLHNMINLHV